MIRVCWGIVVRALRFPVRRVQESVATDVNIKIKEGDALVGFKAVIRARHARAERVQV